MLQLAKCLGFDLTDTLTGDIELTADFFQGAGTSVIQTETQTQNLLFTFCQTAQDIVDLILEQLIGSVLIRTQSIFVLNEIAEMGIVFLADRCFQRYRLKGDLLNFSDLFR